MYLNLPFRFLSFYKDKPVNIVLNMGTLEDICNDVSIDFWELDAFAKDEAQLFMQLILHHGYITGCKERFAKPKYNRKHSMDWANNINATESAKLFILISELFGKFKKPEITEGKTEKKK